jgi:antagonist of KipI
VIDVVVAPPYLAVQDRGRYGFRAAGVPIGGAMDVAALDRAQALLGNDPLDAGFEWALGGGVLRFAAATRIALAGARADATLDGVPVAAERVIDVAPGAMLTVGRLTSGRFLYVAVAGGIDVPRVLASRSTYLPGRFGGLDGRLLRVGDQVATGRLDARRPARASAMFAAASGAIVPAPTVALRVLPGPDYARFHRFAWDAFLATEYRVSPASDRVGYRLDGPPLPDAGLGALASSPLCPGAVQLPPDGRPIVLMVDGPTVGGYPVLAVLLTADRGDLAQRAPGTIVRFTAVRS